MEVFENGGSATLCGRVKTEVFENGGSASLCGRAKTEVFENDYVTGIGMSQLKRQNGYFLIRFRWCSVDGRKRYKNASVDEKLFIRFQETENGGFRKRISVGGQGLCVDERKRRFSVFVWTGENGGFRKRLRHWHWHVPVKKPKRMIFYPFSVVKCGRSKTLHKR